MSPFPVRQFEPSSRLVIDAGGHHYCLAGTPALAAQIVAAVNWVDERGAAVKSGHARESNRPGLASARAAATDEHKRESCQ